MQVSTITTTAVYYTVVVEGVERHFFTAWETISFLSSIDLTAQKN
jgi:hypothetical protein